MSTVLQVENLSKRYRLGFKESRKDTLIGQIGQTLKAPLDNLKRLRSMTSFKEGDDQNVFWALRDINFEVKQGEVLGIIGHNGAGKSTLLKLLSRITEATTGTIGVKGRIAALLEVGTGFHQDLSGRENIYMNGTILGMTKKEIDRKMDEIVAFSGVEKHLDTAVKFYSSGMKVRLGFSVAAHLDPEILIIDEVLAVGDAEFQKKCLGKMESVAGEGRTVLFVSHNMAAVQNLCSRTIVLDRGLIAFSGTVEGGISNYLASSKSKSNILTEAKNQKIESDSLMIEELLLLNKQGDEFPIFKSGELLVIKVKLTSTKNHEHLKIRIQVKSLVGSVLFTLNTYYTENYLSIGIERKIFTCSVSKLPLAQGRYIVDVRAVEFDQVIHEINDAIELNVVGGDFFGTGQQMHAKDGVLVGQQWGNASS